MGIWETRNTGIILVSFIILYVFMGTNFLKHHISLPELKDRMNLTRLGNLCYFVSVRFPLTDGEYNLDFQKNTQRVVRHDMFYSFTYLLCSCHTIGGQEGIILTLLTYNQLLVDNLCKLSYMKFTPTCSLMKIAAKKETKNWSFIKRINKVTKLFF